MTSAEGVSVEHPLGDRAGADPALVWRTIAGYEFYWAAVAAIELGLFDALVPSPSSAADLGPRLDCDPARLTALCDVLVASGLLVRVGAAPDGAFTLSATASAFLVSDAERSMKNLLLRSPGPWENWPGLASTMRGADPPRPADGTFYAGLVEATFPTQFAAARVLASKMSDARAVLDLGAGAAPWSIAFLETFPRATAVAVDLPEVIPAARNAAALHGVGDRLQLVSGDYWQAAIDKESFDIVILAHVVRAEGPRAPDLIRRAAAFLAADGTLAVADYFVDDDRNGPVNSLLLGLTMMSATPDGRTFTRAEHRAWFADAGLGDIENHQLIPGQEVMTARKPLGPSTQTREESRE